MPMPSIRVALVVALLVLVGCVHQPQIPLGSWNERQAQLEKLSHWQVTGKLGVRVPGDSGSANLRWRQLDTHYTIDLSGPLGSGRVFIDGQPGEVSLQQAGEPPHTAATAEELIHYSTGWTIPVTQLIYWVRALPAPKQKVTHWEKNAEDQLTLLEQAGWRIQYSQYEAVTSAAGDESFLLPRRVVAEYGDARLTLVIREWALDRAPLQP